MAKTKKLLQACPKCSYQFKSDDYIANTAICRSCYSSSPKYQPNHNLLYKYRKQLVALTLVFGTLNFSYVVYKNWGQISKKDTAISAYIKTYWTDLQEVHLVSIIQDCLKKNDFQCQMLAYKRLTELDPENTFYKSSYESKLKKYKNPPKLDYNMFSN